MGELKMQDIVLGSTDSDSGIASSHMLHSNTQKHRCHQRFLKIHCLTNAADGNPNPDLLEIDMSHRPILSQMDIHPTPSISSATQTSIKHPENEKRTYLC